MKKKGRIDNTQLTKFGLDLQIPEEPGHEKETNEQDIEAVKQRQNKELK